MKWIVFLVLLIGSWALGAPQKLSRLAPRDGYILSLEEENEREYTEIILPIGPLPQLPYKTWFQRIFDDDELAKEFADRYQRQFGRTEAEQAQSVANPFIKIDVVDINGAVFRGTAIDYQNQRQLFAEYMIRRMFEHNLDKFVKSNPSLRTAYEIKERVSHAEVSVSPGYSLALNYSFSGNTLQIRPINPFFIFEVLYQMNPSQLGPGDISETHWRVGRDFTKKFSVNVYYRQYDAVVSMVLREQFSPIMAGTLTLNTNTRPYGITPREDLALAGLYYSF